MKQFLWFLCVGSAGFIVDLMTFSILTLYLSVHLSRVISFIVAVNLTFALNQKLTFKNQQASYPLYILGQCKGIALNMLTFELTLIIFNSERYITYIAAFITGSVFAMLFNYLFAKKIAFKSTDT